MPYYQDILLQNSIIYYFNFTVPLLCVEIECALKLHIVSPVHFHNLNIIFQTRKRKKVTKIRIVIDIGNHISMYYWGLSTVSSFLKTDVGDLVAFHGQVGCWIPHSFLHTHLNLRLLSIKTKVGNIIPQPMNCTYTWYNRQDRTNHHKRRNNISITNRPRLSYPVRNHARLNCKQCK